jgi:peptidoglycan LD-endopeptidase LytH
VEGIEIFSLYAHLSGLAPGLVAGKRVAAGETIATMGRSSSAEVIAKDRAHLHFELNLFVNDRFAAWFRQSKPGERNDHGIWNGHNLLGLDASQILLAERPGEKRFNLLEFLRRQPELCRVQVRVKNFPFLKRYAALVQKNPLAEKQGIAGYEIVLNYNGVPCVLVPRTESELKSKNKFFLLSVNETIQRANPCGKIVMQRGGRWQLTENGRQEIELLVY